MKKMSDWRIGIMYSNWYYMVLLIVTVSLLIGYLFALVMELDFTFVNVFLRSIISTAIIWGGCVTIVTYSWHKYPWESMPIKHLIIEVLLILLLLTLYIFISAFFLCFKDSSSISIVFQSHIIEIIFTILITFLITTIHEAVFFYQQWKLNFSKSISLEKDNLEARYNALKAQVNPHFLFNSLNSLMSLLDNHPTAEKYVQDLSEYLRYVLLSNSKEEVTLQEELEHLEKFFHLQKLRFEENLTVEIIIQPTSLPLHIPPLALQMLVDNCIKHNIISAKNPLNIKIFDDGKSITVQNNLQTKHTEESTGQGLKNIEGRYRFISNEPIKIVKDDKQFSVTIPLITNEKP
ncbi:MAG: histidine kinase [Paludibacter sp.]